MLRSMTSFARTDRRTDYAEMSWELRSVNHRYLETFVRLPEELRSLENEVRAAVAARLDRGKVECSFGFKASGAAVEHLAFNEPLVRDVSRLCHDVAALMSNPDRVSPLEVLKWPGVLESKRIDPERLRADAMQLLEQALQEMIDTRKREGDKLAVAIKERLRDIRVGVDKVRERLPQLIVAQRARLLKRFEELQVQVDKERVEQEMVILAQRSDVEEELKRLETHISEVERIVNHTTYQPVGRRLDFLMQEMNREANTLCSKSLDVDTTKVGVDMKVYIEQMREQIQNIE